MKIFSDISSIKLFSFRFATLPLFFVSLEVKSDPPSSTSPDRVSPLDWNERTGELPAMTFFQITQSSSSMTSHSSTDSISVIERTSDKTKSHQLDNRRHRRHHRVNEIRHAYYTTRKADRSDHNDDDDDVGNDNNLFGVDNDDYDDDDDDDISNSIQPLSIIDDGKTDSNPQKHLPFAAHRRDSQVRNFNITVVSSGSEEKQEDEGGMAWNLFG